MPASALRSRRREKTLQESRIQNIMFPEATA